MLDPTYPAHLRGSGKPIVVCRGRAYKQNEGVHESHSSYWKSESLAAGSPCEWARTRMDVMLVGMRPLKSNSAAGN